nr:hypothetical protein [Bradyrhizobium yuanmingense]
MTATARKIAVLFYNTLRHGMSYRDPGGDQYEQQYRSRVVANLQRRAKSLGFVLQAIPGEGNPAVSSEVDRDLCWTTEMNFRFIDDRRADYPIKVMCRVLGVSPMRGARAGKFPGRGQSEAAGGHQSGPSRQLWPL